MSLLDECNFEAHHIMCVFRHKSESSIQSYSRSLSEVNQKQNSHAPTSACSVENFKSTNITKHLIYGPFTEKKLILRNILHEDAYPKEKGVSKIQCWSCDEGAGRATRKKCPQT